MHEHTLTQHTLPCTLSHKCIHTNSQIFTLSLSLTHTHAHTHSYADVRACVRAHTHTHTHTQTNKFYLRNRGNVLEVSLEHGMLVVKGDEGNVMVTDLQQHDAACPCCVCCAMKHILRAPSLVDTVHTVLGHASMLLHHKKQNLQTQIISMMYICPSYWH